MSPKPYPIFSLKDAIRGWFRVYGIVYRKVYDVGYMERKRKRGRVRK